MSNMWKELLRKYIKEQNFTSPNEILKITHYFQQEIQNTQNYLHSRSIKSHFF